MSTLWFLVLLPFAIGASQPEAAGSFTSFVECSSFAKKMNSTVEFSKRQTWSEFVCWPESHPLLGDF